ncbi:MAG: NUDIX hydrolase [Phycisphaeraceae bacterium]|nr:NUDIX hydrolase [Phycisphaeraceae bacterium]
MRREPLRQLLLAFSPCDGHEARERDRMIELLNVPGDPFARSHFTPGHFTASAFVLGPEGRLLLIFHGKLHRWLQPGGHVDPDDMDVPAAARREVAEETGLNLSPTETAAVFDLDIHPIPAMRGEPAHEHFDVRFLFRTRETTIAAASDAKAARWYTPDEVTLELSDTSVMRAMRKIIR